MKKKYVKIMLNKEEGEKFAELLGKLDNTELAIAKGSIEILQTMNQVKGPLIEAKQK